MKYEASNHLRIVKVQGEAEPVVLSGFYRVAQGGERMLGGFQGKYGQFVEVPERRLMPDV